MSELWGPLDENAWRNVHVTQDRLASEADVQEGRAVFYLDLSGGAKAEPFRMDLPSCAILKSDCGGAIPVVVIQAVATESGVVAGYRTLEGGNGVCLLEELEVLGEPDDSFFER